VISNTFSITIAQRLSELALLRTPGRLAPAGAARVLLEALLLAPRRAAGAWPGGLLVAPGIVAIFAAVGLELPTSDTVVLPRTVVVSLPGRHRRDRRGQRRARAARHPRAADRRHARGRRPAAALGAHAGHRAAVLGAPAWSPCSPACSAAPRAATPPGLLGPRAPGVVFLAVALFSPQLVGPLARLVGAPFQRLGLTGRLARENATRQPGGPPRRPPR
jgi:putative ABC transport system permease protein